MCVKNLSRKNDKRELKYTQSSNRGLVRICCSPIGLLVAVREESFGVVIARALDEFSFQVIVDDLLDIAAIPFGLVEFTQLLFAHHPLVEAARD